MEQDQAAHAHQIKFSEHGVYICTLPFRTVVRERSYGEHVIPVQQHGVIALLQVQKKKIGRAHV